jgi:hypothetical protein
LNCIVVDAKNDVNVIFNVVVFRVVQVNAAIPIKLEQARVELKAMEEGIESKI